MTFYSDVVSTTTKVWEVLAASKKGDLMTRTLTPMIHVPDVEKAAK